MTTTFSFNDLSDRQLHAEVTRLASSEREATARLVASLAEVDARRLYLSEGCSSLFTYCTQVLHLSEHAAYNRIEAARTARLTLLLSELERTKLAAATRPRQRPRYQPCRDIFLRLSNVACGTVTAAGAPLSAITAGAPKRVSWSF